MANIEKVNKFDYTDIMFWLGIALMVIWIIAKALNLLGYL